MAAKYGRITVEGKDIPEDEPQFLIRGADVTAPDAIRCYADNLFHGLLTRYDIHRPVADARDARDRIRAYADEVEAWQAAHPDRVKVPD